VDVKKMGCRQHKVAQWSNCAARDFVALAELASPCPDAAILLYAWPHKTLYDQLHRCFDGWVRQIMDELEGAEMYGRRLPAEVSQ
jgi:hypothetical protein